MALPDTVAPADDGRPAWLIPAAVVALLVLAGIAFAALRRRRRPYGAGDDRAAEVVEPSPVRDVEPARPEIVPAPPPVAPAVPAAAPAVRPWIGLSLVPLRAGVNLATATADVEVTLTNVGDAPANAIRVGVSLLSARSGQDEELGRLFAQPIARPAVAPFALAVGEARTVRVLVTLPRSVLNVLDAGGRPMFVPVVAANVVYDRGDGGTGQTAAAFVVGIDRPGAAKLGPFWLDTPGRIHDALGIRPHALSLRS